MKIKIFTVCAFLMCGNAWGDNEDGGGTTFCTGTSTQNTDQTFSNVMGSGYILKQVFRGTCICPKL